MHPTMTTLYEDLCVPIGTWNFHTRTRLNELIVWRIEGLILELRNRLRDESNRHRPHPNQPHRTLVSRLVLAAPDPGISQRDQKG